MACYGISCRKEKPCIICGKPILSGANKKTCSRSCANKHRAGIKYKLNRPRDKVKSYQALKIRLLKVKGGNCERCGYNKYEILQVHHKDRNRFNNELDNLELICPNCHFEEHYLEKSWLKTLPSQERCRELVIRTVLKTVAPNRACGFESHPLRQLGNEAVGSPATRARQPFFGEISSHFEFSKAKSGIFLVFIIE